MKILQYSTVLLLLLTVSGLYAQKKKYKEEFIVKPDVVIDINTRHSDIEIETWNKNKVVIEAYMIVEGEDFSEEEYNEFYKKWDFEAKGNSGEITIKSRTNSAIDIYALNLDNIDYDVYTHPLANFSLGSLDVLDSIDFIMPPLPPEAPVFLGFEFPELPELPELPQEFDFEAYKKDKGYLKRWKKENEDVIGKNATIKIGRNSINIKSDDTNITMNQRKKKVEYLKSIQEERKRYQEEIKLSAEKYKELRRQQMETRKEQLEERRKDIAEMKKNLKEQLKNRKTKRIEIQKVLKERSKLKVKRIIKIKAPKNAKLNMNVKYGELSFTQ